MALGVLGALSGESASSVPVRAGVVSQGTALVIAGAAFRLDSGNLEQLSRLELQVRFNYKFPRPHWKCALRRDISCQALTVT